MANPIPAPVGLDLTALPKRTHASSADLDAARAWLTVIESNGAASDGETYATPAEARNAGMRLARLVEHVTPNGMRPSVRTFGLDASGSATSDPDAITGHGFAVSLKAPKSEGKSKSGK